VVVPSDVQAVGPRVDRLELPGEIEAVHEHRRVSLRLRERERRETAERDVQGMVRRRDLDTPDVRDPRDPRIDGPAVGGERRAQLRLLPANC
jgi:hypothetical protein